MPNYPSGGNYPYGKNRCERKHVQGRWLCFSFRREVGRSRQVEFTLQLCSFFSSLTKRRKACRNIVGTDCMTLLGLYIPLVFNEHVSETTTATVKLGSTDSPPRCHPYVSENFM